MTHLLPCPLICRLEEVPLEVLRQRESKWLDMLNNWDKWMAKKHKKVRGVAWRLGPGAGVNSLGGEGKGWTSLQQTGGFSSCQAAEGLLHWSGDEQKLALGWGKVCAWHMTSEKSCREL